MALLLVILIPLAAVVIYAVVYDLRRRWRRSAPRSNDISSAARMARTDSDAHGVVGLGLGVVAAVLAAGAAPASDHPHVSRAKATVGVELIVERKGVTGFPSRPRFMAIGARIGCLSNSRCTSRIILAISRLLIDTVPMPLQRLLIRKLVSYWARGSARELPIASAALTEPKNGP